MNKKNLFILRFSAIQWTALLLCVFMVWSDLAHALPEVAQPSTTSTQQLSLQDRLDNAYQGYQTVYAYQDNSLTFIFHQEVKKSLNSSQIQQHDRLQKVYAQTEAFQSIHDSLVQITQPELKAYNQGKDTQEQLTAQDIQPLQMLLASIRDDIISDQDYAFSIEDPAYDPQSTDDKTFEEHQALYTIFKNIYEAALNQAMTTHLHLLLLDFPDEKKIDTWNQEVEKQLTDTYCETESDFFKQPDFPTNNELLEEPKKTNVVCYEIAKNVIENLTLRPHYSIDDTLEDLNEGIDQSNQALILVKKNVGRGFGLQYHSSYEQTYLSMFNRPSGILLLTNTFQGQHPHQVTGHMEDPLGENDDLPTFAAVMNGVKNFGSMTYQMSISAKNALLEAAGQTTSYQEMQVAQEKTVNPIFHYNHFLNPQYFKPRPFLKHNTQEMYTAQSRELVRQAIEEAIAETKSGIDELHQILEDFGKKYAQATKNTSDSWVSNVTDAMNEAVLKDANQDIKKGIQELIAYYPSAAMLIAKTQPAMVNTIIKQMVQTTIKQRNANQNQQTVGTVMLIAAGVLILTGVGAGIGAGLAGTAAATAGWIMVGNIALITGFTMGATDAIYSGRQAYIMFRHYEKAKAATYIYLKETDPQSYRQLYSDYQVQLAVAILAGVFAAVDIAALKNLANIKKVVAQKAAQKARVTPVSKNVPNSATSIKQQLVPELVVASKKVEPPMFYVDESLEEVNQSVLKMRQLIDTAGIITDDVIIENHLALKKLQAFLSKSGIASDIKKVKTLGEMDMHEVLVLKPSDLGAGTKRISQKFDVAEIRIDLLENAKDKFFGGATHPGSKNMYLGLDEVRYLADDRISKVKFHEDGHMMFSQMRKEGQESAYHITFSRDMDGVDSDPMQTLLYHYSTKDYNESYLAEELYMASKDAHRTTLDFQHQIRELNQINPQDSEALKEFVKKHNLNEFHNQSQNTVDELKNVIADNYVFTLDDEVKFIDYFANTISEDVSDIMGAYALKSGLLQIEIVKNPFDSEMASVVFKLFADNGSIIKSATVKAQAEVHLVTPELIQKAQRYHSPSISEAEKNQIYRTLENTARQQLNIFEDGGLASNQSLLVKKLKSLLERAMGGEKNKSILDEIARTTKEIKQQANEGFKGHQAQVIDKENTLTELAKVDNYKSRSEIDQEVIDQAALKSHEKNMSSHLGKYADKDKADFENFSKMLSKISASREFDRTLKQTDDAMSGSGIDSGITYIHKEYDDLFLTGDLTMYSDDLPYFKNNGAGIDQGTLSSASSSLTHEQRIAWNHVSLALSKNKKYIQDKTLRHEIQNRIIDIHKIPLVWDEALGKYIVSQEKRQKIDSLKRFLRSHDYNTPLTNQQLNNANGQTYEDLSDYIVRRLENLAPLTASSDAAKKKILYLTHQNDKFAAHTKAIIERDFADTPKVFLVSDDFPINEPDLLAKATVVQRSQVGELNDQIMRGTDIHFAGGYCEVCLSNSIADVLTDFRNNSKLSELEVTIHADISYMRGYKNNALFNHQPIHGFTQTDKVYSLSEIVGLYRKHINPQIAEMDAYEAFLKQSFISRNRSEMGYFFFDSKYIGQLKTDSGIRYTWETTIDGKKLIINIEP